MDDSFFLLESACTMARTGQMFKVKLVKTIDFKTLKELLKVPYANQSKRALRPNSTATASAWKEDSTPSNHRPCRASV